MGADAKTVCILIDRPRFSAYAEGKLLTGYDAHFLAEKAKRCGLLPNQYVVESISQTTSLPTEYDFEVTRARLNQRNYSVILSLDEIALNFLTGKKSIGKWHLSPLDAMDGFSTRKVVPTFHFDQIKKEYYLNLYFEMALRRAANATERGPWNRKQARYLLNPSVDESIATLESILHKEWHSIDIETGRNQINTFGVAWTGEDAIAIKMLPDTLPAAAHHKLWELIRKLCESDSPKVMQNGIYERMYLSRYGIYINNLKHDTMCANKFLWPELEKGLDNVGRLYTMEPYWKDDGRVASEEGKQKDWGDIRDWPRHFDYNCLARGMRVHTEQGLIPINEIVSKRLRIKVKSWNAARGVMEYKPVTNYLHKREKQRIEWVQVQCEGMRGKSGLLVTPDHKILTERGWIRADKLKVRDFMLTEGLCHNAGTLFGTLLGDSSYGYTSDSTVAYVQCSQIHPELINLKAKLFGGTVTSAYRKTGFGENTFYSLYIPPTAQVKRMSTAPLDEILNHLTPAGIALWLMDDGCQQIGKYPAMRLALQGYTPEEREIIRRYFESRYGQCNLHKAGNLAFTCEASKNLCAEISPFVVPALRYKLSHPGMPYNDSAYAPYMTKVSPINNRIVGLNRVVKEAKGYSTSYCISVKDNKNFLTEFGIVANCKDSSNTLIACHNQRRDLAERGLQEAYDRLVQQSFDAIYEMCCEGFPLNPETQQRLIAEYETKSDALIKQLSKEINPRSPKQKMELLREKGYKLPIKRSTKKESVDELSLKKLRLSHPEDNDLKLLLEISGIEKALSSYLRVQTFDDKRIRYMLDPHGTETGRMSCTLDPWGLGFNAQTMPDYTKEMIEWPAELDRIFVEIDLSQAESRFVAYDACEENLLGMLERKEDIHRYVAAEIYMKAMADITHDERQLGKKSGHGANYNMGVTTFMDSCLKEMDLVLSRQMATRVLEAYHKLFPGIRRWHARIRNEVYRERKLTNPLGRVRYFYGRPDDNTYREAYAYRPQSTVPDIANALMNGLRGKRTEGVLDFRLHMQTHDSITLSCASRYLTPIHKFSQNLDSWHPEIILPAGKLRIPTEVKYGKCLGKMIKVS